MSGDEDESPQGNYVVSEKLLAFHGPVIYDAVCNGIRKDADDELQYFVHYLGWSKSWDEWVVEDRLLKMTPENIRRKEQVMEEVKNNSAKEKRARKAARKRKLDDGIEMEDEASMKHEISIPIPNVLQKLMISDWERINRNHKLVPLPRSPNVDDILNNFVGAKNRKPDAGKDTNEVANGLRIYFERALSARLLYRVERPQYEEAMADPANKAATSVYGMEHLLRLFVVLPSLMAQTTMTKEQKQIIVSRVTQLLKFLSKKQEWFSQEYTPMEPQYLDKVKNMKSESS